jgi:hypothetical protein
VDPTSADGAPGTLIDCRSFRLPQLVSAYPSQAALIATLDGLSALAADQHTQALNALLWAWRTNLVIENHPFVHKYLRHATVTVERPDSDTTSRLDGDGTAAK